MRSGISTRHTLVKYTHFSSIRPLIRSLQRTSQPKLFLRPSKIARRFVVLPVLNFLRGSTESPTIRKSIPFVYINRPMSWTSLPKRLGMLRISPETSMLAQRPRKSSGFLTRSGKNKKTSLSCDFGMIFRTKKSQKLPENGRKLAEKSFPVLWLKFRRILRMCSRSTFFNTTFITNPSYATKYSYILGGTVRT